MTNETVTAAAPAAPPKPEGDGNKLVGFLIHWGPTLLFNIAGPTLLYSNLVDHHGMSKAHALMLASLLPLLEIAAIYLITRRIDDFGVFTLITMALTLLSFLAFNSAKAILYKDSGITAVIGLAILGSLLTPRPFAFFMGRKFATDGSAASREWWNGMWQYPGFRHTSRVITVVWGVGFCLESAVRVVLIGFLSVKTMVSLSNILMYATIGVIIFFTISYSKRRAAEAQKRFGAAVTAPETA